MAFIDESVERYALILTKIFKRIVSVQGVTHDPRVEDIADRILWLEDGKIIDRKAESHQWIKDPVCGMRVDEWRALHFIEYHGARYAFCSRRCRERFVAGPEKYTE